MPVFHNMEPYQHDFYTTNSPSFVPSPSASSVCSMNTDGNIQMYGSTMSSPLSSNMSPNSSNMSPMSSSSSTSNSNMYAFNNLQIGSPHDYMISSTSPGKPFLEIIEKPIDKFRFRYKSEMHGTHGSLTGQGASRSNKRFPTVRLNDFNGEALIRCSLYQIPKANGKFPSPHSHSLIIRCGNEDRKDPHEIMVSQINDYTATFQGMGIIHTARNFIETELFQKLVAKMHFELGRNLTALEEESLRNKAKNEKEDMNLNQVSLCFEAYERIHDKWVKLCEPLFSTPINNMKSALTGELKISRLSTIAGNAAGNEDLFMFVEKVGKKNIKVRFYEMDDDAVVWEDWGKFTEADVHHQYAIALKTPPYRTTNIDETVKVNIQLYRPGDEAISEPVEFRYKPSYNTNGNRKRPRITSTYNEIPVVVTENRFNCSPTDNYVPQPEAFNIDANSGLDDILNFFENLDNVDVPTLTSEDCRSILNNIGFGENSDFDKLAKDAVCQNNNQQTQTSLPEMEKVILRMFKKLSPLLDAVNTEENEKKIKIVFNYLLTKVCPDGESLVHVCIKSAESKLVEQLWKIIDKLNLYNLLKLRNDRKETCIHVACSLNKMDILAKLLQYGADVNAIDYKGNTGLHIAIQEGNDKCVSTILNPLFKLTNNETKLDLNIRNFNGCTPLHLAAKKDNLNVVKMLEQKAIELRTNIFDMVEGKNGNSALHIAVESDSNRVAEYIIQNKCVSPTKTNQSGHTALYLARATKSNDLVHLMQKHSICDIENCAVDDEDDTSSKDSFDSIEITTTPVEAKNAKISELKSRVEGRFDDLCFTDLSTLLNKNAKWKILAEELGPGYEEHIESWQKLRNPTKVLLILTESLKVSKYTLISIFEKIGEQKAIDIINKWKNRVK